jgi:hypothetical protein
MHDFKLLPQSRQELHSSGLLHSSHPNFPDCVTATEKSTSASGQQAVVSTFLHFCWQHEIWSTGSCMMTWVFTGNHLIQQELSGLQQMTRLNTPQWLTFSTRLK